VKRHQDNVQRRSKASKPKQKALENQRSRAFLLSVDVQGRTSSSRRAIKPGDPHKRLNAYFSPSRTAFQTDGGRDFNVIVDDGGGAQVMF
jgi:hypothetical protein